MNKMNLREFAEVLVAMMNQQGTVCFLNNDNPAKQLGYSSIEEMRIQEHEIIASDDSDNTVAEGYWYPDGNRNSLTYIKIQRDTLYWYEFNPEQGDVQVGEAEERRNAGYDRTKIVMQIIKSNVRRKV